MRYLITGCSGFLGTHLGQKLVASGHEVYGTHCTRKIIVPKVKALHCDFTDEARVREVVKQSQPDVIYHLAAQSNIVASWKNLPKTLAVNVCGTHYLLQAIKEQVPNSRTMIFGSSSEYGSLPNGKTRHCEGHQFRPGTPYALSKVAEDLLGHIYADAFQISVICVRPFYIIGPRKEPDAPSDFAKAIVQCRRGKTKQLKVGNLDVVRDVVDVRDAISALNFIEKKGLSGNTYNLCSGKGTKLKTILKGLLELSSSDLEIVVDPGKFRRGEDARIVGSPERIRRLGWVPIFSLKETLTSIMNYWSQAI